MNRNFNKGDSATLEINSACMLLIQEQIRNNSASKLGEIKNSQPGPQWFLHKRSV